ncbi:MAG: HAMP domain-containing sensor histidine kinase, partial [Lachnospiraceae bacterium]
GKTYIAYYSTFVRNGSKFTLVTYSDITHVLEDNNVLRKRYFIMYLIVLSCGTVFALVFSLHLTRPVDRLTEAGERFAGGDYSARITKIPNDELGRLSEVYNSMADTIQLKIEDLNLSVKQKEDFIRAFAHETKTPMTGIIGYADLIYQDRLEGNERKEAAGVILGEGMRLQALSLKLLDIMTLGNENILMEEMNTTEMAHDLENTVRIKAEEKGVEVQCLVEDEYIYVDYDLFKTVLINLADNSIKAGAKVINIRGFRKEYDYIFEVKDDGIGIPASELHRVKEAFYMVDKSRSRKEHGAGLGLSLAERIMTLHKGSLEIESVEGEGTVVRLTLPDKNKNVTSGTD